MKLLKAFWLLLRSAVTALAETIINPERVLHQLILDMEEELERVRGRVAGVMADEVQLGRRAAAARAESSTWRQRAQDTLQRGDEAAARAALEQKVQADQRAEAMEAEHGKQKEQTAALQRAVRRLEDRIRQARQKQALLAARLARADSARQIQQVLDRTDSGSAQAVLRQLEERVERAEALEQAHDRLLGDDPGADDRERQFEEQQRRERLQKEFEELQRRVANED